MTKFIDCYTTFELFEVANRELHDKIINRDYTRTHRQLQASSYPFSTFLLEEAWRGHFPSLRMLSFSDLGLMPSFAMHRLSGARLLPQVDVAEWKFALRQVHFELLKDHSTRSLPLLLHRSQVGRSRPLDADVDFTIFNTMIDVYGPGYGEDSYTDIYYFGPDSSNSDSETEEEEDEEEKDEEEDESEIEDESQDEKETLPRQWEVVMQFQAEVRSDVGQTSLEVFMCSASGYKVEYQVSAVPRDERRKSKGFHVGSWVERGRFSNDFHEKSLVSKTVARRLHHVLTRYRTQALVRSWNPYHPPHALFSVVNNHSVDIEDWLHPPRSFAKWGMSISDNVARKHSEPLLNCFLNAQVEEFATALRSAIQAALVDATRDLSIRLMTPNTMVQEENRIREEVLADVIRVAHSFSRSYWDEVLKLPGFLSWKGSSLITWPRFFQHVRDEALKKRQWSIKPHQSSQ